MLNKSGERELCYLIKIDNIEPIQGSDNCECAIVGGWHVMVRKGEFTPNSIGIYFEIDSLVPSDNPAFSFLEKRHYKVKTQKYTFGGKGNFISQGLLMHPMDFGWFSDDINVVKTEKGVHCLDDETKFLTSELGVKYAEAADNVRKAPSVDKYKKMAQRMGKKASKFPYRQMLKTNIGKKILFLFFGRKTKTNGWPEWVSKTDEERIQNQTWRFANPDEKTWTVTEKIDGTSTTFTMKRKGKLIVCSRNVAFDSPDKKCFYETNVYTEMAVKYNIEQVLTDILKENPNLIFVTIQGETYGEGVQKRDYSIKGHDFAAFNVIFGFKDGNVVRLQPNNMKEFLDKFNIPSVPILETGFHLPANCDEMLAYAEGKSAIDGLPREGVVLRSEEGEYSPDSFKAVSNTFLLKYHG